MMASRFVSVATDSNRSLLASDLVIVGELGFISGVRPVDLTDDRVPLPEMVEAQTEKIFFNLDTILAASGLTQHDPTQRNPIQRNLISVRIHLIDFDRLVERMNRAYLACIGTAPLPARSCTGVLRLTRGALVEMDFTVRITD